MITLIVFPCYILSDPVGDKDTVFLGEMFKTDYRNDVTDFSVLVFFEHDMYHNV